MEHSKFLKCPSCGNEKWDREAHENVQISVEEDGSLSDEILSDFPEYEYKCQNCGQIFKDYELGELVEKNEEVIVQ